MQSWARQQDDSKKNYAICFLDINKDAMCEDVLHHADMLMKDQTHDVQKFKIVQHVIAYKDRDMYTVSRNE